MICVKRWTCLIRDPSGWLALRCSIQAELALDEEVGFSRVQKAFLLHDLAGDLEGKHQLMLLEQAQADIAEDVPRQGFQNVLQPLCQVRCLHIIIISYHDKIWMAW